MTGATDLKRKERFGGVLWGYWPMSIVLLLMAAQIACGVATSVSSSDTNRDIFFAQQIASGKFFPLTGPDINGTFHVGPLWYYLLAPILLVASNAAAVTGFMAALSAIQFPLAYKLGERQGSRLEGILFVLMLAIPAWTVVSFGALTHTVTIASALLVGALAAQNYRTHPEAKSAVLVGLASTLMLTAHPTLVVFAGLLIVWAGKEAPRRLSSINHAVLVLLPVLLSLLPMAYEQWRGGFADVATTSRYTQSEWSMPSFSNGLRLLFATIFYAPKYLTHFWLQLSSTQEQILFSIYALLMLAAVVGLITRFWREQASRHLILWLSGALLIDSIFLCSIRSTMPPWMVYALWPLIAALGALGLKQICAQHVGRLLVSLCLLVTTLWTLTVYASLVPGPLDHAEIKPSEGKHALLDIRDYEENELHYRLARIPFRHVFALGDPLCEPVTLYGHYAYLVDYTFAVGAAERCGTTANVEFGGMPTSSRRALLGLHESVWNSVHMKPERWLSTLGLVEKFAVWHSPVALMPSFPRFTNWPREIKKETVVFTVKGDASADQAILIAHRAHRYASFEVIEGRANGNIVKPVYSDVTAVVFRLEPTSSSEPVHWELSIRAVAEYVDVLAFRGADN
jgi:hypothetical protein